MRLFLIALGGGGGAVSRYLLSLWIKDNTNSAFPFATFTVNILGAFLLAFLLQASSLDQELKIMLTTGFMGAFTTYSTFSYEIFNLFKTGETLYGILYIFLTIVLALVGTVSGFYLGKLLFN